MINEHLKRSKTKIIIFIAAAVVLVGSLVGEYMEYKESAKIVGDNPASKLN